MSPAAFSDPSADPSAHLPVRLLAIIVLYKQRPCDSLTVQTLLSAASTIEPSLQRLQIVLWDNTPGGQDTGTLPEGCRYMAAPTNPGLAVAYNTMLSLAETEGYDWLLTLDQDSGLPANYLRHMAQLVRQLSPNAATGAIVPQVISDGRTISPFRYVLGAVPRWFPKYFVGEWPAAVYAANSGAILRIRALLDIGGYDRRFPLDLSDSSTFHRLALAGWRVFIAGDLTLDHNFALHDKASRMTLERYHVSLLDDGAFFDLYMSPAARLERILRFSVRYLKEWMSPGSPAFRKRTFAEVRRRLFRSRKARLEEWQRWAAAHRPES